MDYKERYNQWCEKANEDTDLINDLKNYETNEEEKYESFYTTLKFGTAGLRGIIGAGTNRMNIYVVRQATQGVANYIKKTYGTGSVSISYDSRIKASLFAIESARVLAANGIKVYITKELEPTPVLSFLTRYFKCQAGIMVTASHNPAKYNGYKVYGYDGCQITDDAANFIYNEIQNVDMFNGIKLVDFNCAINDKLIEYVDDSVYDEYLKNVKAQQINPSICDDSNLKVVYTPLNGAGNKLVRKILEQTGVKNVTIVKEQELPDGNFTTCPYPNPELKEALKLGLDLSEQIKPDLLLATDPDSDRVAVAAKDSDGNFRILSGNETGVLLVDYILSSRIKNNTLPENPIIVKTIVTTQLVNKICNKYGAECCEVLTGFKYIGDVILKLEQKNEEKRYVFGFEESCGYLSGTYVRDKDAVVASMLVCEMAAYYKKQNKNLVQAINDIYAEYGYFMNTTLSFEFDGAAGMDKMAKIMKNFRDNPPQNIAGINIVETADYQKSIKVDLLTNTETTIDLPKSNVIGFKLNDGSGCIIRPSGTEPKIKLYITAVAKTKDDAQVLTDIIAKDMNEYLQ